MQQEIAHDASHLPGVGAVDDAVVGRRNEHEDRSHDDRPVDNDRLVLDRADREVDRGARERQRSEERLVEPERADVGHERGAEREARLPERPPAQATGDEAGE